jgi:hypothetical protein
MDAEKLKEFIGKIVKGLVDKPQLVNVSASETRQSLHYLIEVDESDVGHVIGRDGRTINALRLIVQAAYLSKLEPEAVNRYLTLDVISPVGRREREKQYIVERVGDRNGGSEAKWPVKRRGPQNRRVN